MNRREIFELQRYIETSCMYDNCTPYTTVPKYRGNCLNLAMHYIEMASQIPGAEYLHTHLVTRSTPGLLEHAVALYNDKTHLPWIIDIPYGILSPLSLGIGVDVYMFYRTSNKDYRLDLDGVIFDVNLSNYVSGYQEIEPLLNEYQKIIPGCAVKPLVSCEFVTPFSISFNHTDYTLKEFREKTVEGKFNNGVEDSGFSRATEKFFGLMRDHYTNIPFKDEDEFLASAAEFLNGYPNLPTI